MIAMGRMPAERTGCHRPLPEVEAVILRTPVASKKPVMVPVLNQPAELIPMSAVPECATELGTQLAHECIPDTALFITYNPCSILDVEDARYLIAPALVYGLVDNEPAPMTDVECAAAQKILAERTVTLTADGEEFHALKLFD